MWLRKTNKKPQNYCSVFNMAEKHGALQRKKGFSDIPFASWMTQPFLNRVSCQGNISFQRSQLIAWPVNVRRKFKAWSINNPALSLLMKHLVIGQRLKTPNFSAFHWSPRGSLVSVGQHFVTTKVVHLPKSTETSLITESDQSGTKHQLLQLCMASTAWSDSDQAVRAVHSCNSWFLLELVVIGKGVK